MYKTLNETDYWVRDKMPEEGNPWYNYRATEYNDVFYSTSRSPNPEIPWLTSLCNCVGWAWGAFFETFWNSTVEMGVEKPFADGKIYDNPKDLCATRPTGDACYIIEAWRNAFGPDYIVELDDDNKYDAIPPVGGMIVYNYAGNTKRDGAGHVVYVQEVNDDGTVKISQSSWGSKTRIAATFDTITRGDPDDSYWVNGWQFQPSKMNHSYIKCMGFIINPAIPYGPNYSKLRRLFNELYYECYTDESWKKFWDDYKNLYEEVERVLDAKNSTEDEVDKLIDDLTKAAENLVHIHISNPDDKDYNDDPANHRNAKKIWDLLLSHGFKKYAAAGIMGNMWAESGFEPNNLQNTAEGRLGYTDEEYTTAVSNGTYRYSGYADVDGDNIKEWHDFDNARDSFTWDEAGYGLIQWTHHDIKQGLYDYFVSTHAESIGDLEMQIGCLVKQLGSKFDDINAEQSVRGAAVYFLEKVERPANWDSESTRNARTLNARRVYCCFKDAISDVVPPPPPTPKPCAYIKIDNSMKLTIPHIRTSNGWEEVVPMIFYNGGWRKIYTF